MRFFIPGLLLWCCTAAFSQTPYFYPEQLVVNASSLNLREKPSAQSKKIASLTRGTLLEYIDAHNNNEYVEIDSVWGAWLKVRYKDQTGYVFGAHVSGTTALYYEDTFIFDDLPKFNWYGVYMRDSFADELRKIEVRIEQENNEFFGPVKILKTNQKDRSKFLVGSVQPLKPGYAGHLGIFGVHEIMVSDVLQPGTMISVNAGSDIGDTTSVPGAYTFVSTGCAVFTGEMMEIKDYRLTLLDYATSPVTQIDMTEWVRTNDPAISPNVSVYWYGDIDGDKQPDVVINDCPGEIGCRSSLFLSSKARKGERMRKTCEFFWPID